MVIYDSKNGRLFIPEKNDQFFIEDPEAIYKEAFEKGYQDGYEEGIRECAGE